MATAKQARAELARRELQRRGGAKPETSFQELSSLKGKPLGQQIWQGLKVPSQMSERGFNEMAGMMPNNVTGNLPRDIRVNAPRIGMETLAKVAPGFISRGSMLMAGASPVIGAIGKGLAPVGRSVASGLEDWAGIRPSGTLSAAAKDASLLFAKGKDAAGKFYKAEPELGEASFFSGMYKPEQIVDKAREIIGKGGKLEPSEGLMYRKAIDSLMKSGRYVKDELLAMRREADAIAKSSENIAAGDVVSKRGMMANAMRSLLPKNVGGRASPFKVGEALAVSHLGPVGKTASLAFSPLALGIGATGLGAAGRIASNPGSAVAALQLLRKFRHGDENTNPQ